MTRKVLFMNSSPNKEGTTYRLGEEILKGIEHETLHLVDYHIDQYGDVSKEDQIKEVFEHIEKADALLIGSPIYWYSVGGLLKTFIDRFYMLPEAELLKGKDLYFFAQGSGPNELTEQTIQYLMTRVATLLNMNLKVIVVDNAMGHKILEQVQL